MTEKTRTEEEVKDLVSQAYRAGEAAGAAQAIPPEFPNRQVHQEPGGEAGHQAYEAELQTLVLELQKGDPKLVGTRLREHPQVAELRTRHGR